MLHSKCSPVSNRVHSLKRNQDRRVASSDTGSTCSLQDCKAVLRQSSKTYQELNDDGGQVGLAKASETHFVNRENHEKIIEAKMTEGSAVLNSRHEDNLRLPFVVKNEVDNESVNFEEGKTKKSPTLQEVTDGIRP